VGLDATPAGHGIYAQRGFVQSSGLVRMRAAPAASDDPPAGVTRLVSSDLDAVLARDRGVFGADRGAVLRWAHASAPDLAWATPGGAYCFGRHGDHSDHVGPIGAEDRESALALVRACLSLPRRRPLILDARVEPGWQGALGELGFREQRPFTRMHLGAGGPAACPALEPAVFGPEFG
jgi:hypothetical protein